MGEWPRQQYHSKSERLVDDGSEFGRVVAHVSHDMTQPLPHYFASAAHNSYLDGNQMTGRASTRTLSEQLLLGCRVIELDCHEPLRRNSCFSMIARPDDVIVRHRHSLTSHVTFTECISAIQKCAFASSRYPLIISLDMRIKRKEWLNHMAGVLNNYLQDHLYIPSPEERRGVFKSPAELTFKILIRTAVDTLAGTTLLPLVAIPKINKRDCFTALEPASVSFQEEQIDSKLKRNVVNPTSIRESEQSIRDFRAMARRHLVRTYPDGVRVDSSNYCPWSMWYIGASFATLNWQVWDVDVMTNLAFFRDNGACGYYLKPDFVLWPDRVAEPELARLTLLPIGYRVGRASPRSGKASLVVNVHGTRENLAVPEAESRGRNICDLQLQRGALLMIPPKAGRNPCEVDVAPALGVATIRVVHKRHEGMICLPLQSLRPGRWWFPVLSRTGRIPANANAVDYIAMDVNLTAVAQ